ncbi:MAG: Fe-S cluster assembly protein SufD [Candidatus Marinimicrobia bacterium]|nr:Fe-S cluster assembly protein SufD [Candidatus Neomarinimicrobiota bacterium]MCF7828036.1 Fe-S cluster assembly protein SufD [Candidatus Neomarinimicrobiota bacterium]MCF7879209.1 Fe-S cluster assembly protein SufD [Candidatus Neomarinimicrobiota bacterium]
MASDNGHTQGFTREQMYAISEAKEEPAWVKEQREAAYNTWEELPMPTTKDEEWRRTDISHIDFGAFTPYTDVNGEAVTSVEELPDATKDLVQSSDQRGGLLYQGDSEVQLTKISEDLREKGVIFTSLEQAVKEHPELVKEYLFTKVMTPQYSKFAALNGAFWSGGAFLFVPKNVEVDIPFEALFTVNKPNAVLAQHNLIILEENASAQFVEVFRSANDEIKTLHNGISEVFLNDNARMNYTSIQSYNQETYDFSNKRAHIGRDARMTWVVSNFGSKLAKNHIDSVCAGEGANADALGLYFLDNTQHLDTGVLLKLETPHTTGESIFKGALKDKSRSVFQGLIKIDRDAQLTEAELENKNLLLDKGARADSIPVLEIEADDVKAGHGATVGRINDDQMYYLRSRGLSKQQAERVIISGFFKDVTKHIGSKSTKDLIDRLIQEKIEKIAE